MHIEGIGLPRVLLGTSVVIRWLQELKMKKNEMQCLQVCQLFKSFGCIATSKCPSEIITHSLITAPLKNHDLTSMRICHSIFTPKHTGQVKVTRKHKITIIYCVCYPNVSQFSFVVDHEELLRLTILLPGTSYITLPSHPSECYHPVFYDLLHMATSIT